MVWPSRRGLVDAGSDCSRQPASRRSRSAGSRPGGAVGREAGKSGRAVGLRGFASPDVLKYCLAVFGIPVSNYSDSSPQASGQLWQSWAEVFLRVFVEMIMKKDKVSPRGYIK